MRLKILNKNEKREIENKLNKQFGIEKIPGIILKKGAERLFLFQGNFDKKQIAKLEQSVPIEKAGVYFANYPDTYKEEIFDYIFKYYPQELTRRC